MTQESHGGLDERAKSVEVTALICVECWHLWLDPRERWRVYVTDDEPPEAVFYCPACAEREFGR